MFTGFMHSIEKQVEDPVAQAELIKEMAQRNANKACHRVILGMSIDPSSTSTDDRSMCQESRAFSAPERKLELTKPKTAASVAPGVAGHQSSFNMSSASSVRSQDTLPETVLKVSSRRRKFKKEKPPMNKKTRTRAWNCPML